MGDGDLEVAGRTVAVEAELAAQRELMARVGLRSGRSEVSMAWPEDVTGAPLIIDTDIGGDPDDTVALAVAARDLSELALVATGDETGRRAGGYGQRARAARWLLDVCGRPEVPVVAGAALDDIDHFVLAGAVPHSIPDPDPGVDVVDAVADLAARRGGPLRWVGIAPMTNLARVINERPEVAARLHVTQMGAAINYRHPDRAEHNVRLDLDAARTVLDAARQRRLASLELVTSDVTFTDAIALDADHPLCRRLRTAPAAWAQMLHISLTRWFAHPRGYDHSMQHDALTLSAALELPFVESIPAHVAFDPIGRLVHVHDRDAEALPASGDGPAPVLVAQRADSSAFMRWLQRSLDEVAPRPPADAPAASRPTGPDSSRSRRVPDRGGLAQGASR